MMLLSSEAEILDVLDRGGARWFPDERLGGLAMMGGIACVVGSGYQWFDVVGRTYQITDAGREALAQWREERGAE